MEKQFIMPSFKETIKIEIDVDQIARQMLSCMDKDNPHRELITYNVIGYMKENSQLGKLYSAISGWHKDLNVEIGKTYSIDCKHLNFWNTEKKPTGLYPVKVTKVNPFAANTTEIEYTFESKDKDNKSITTTRNIDHELLSEYVAPEPVEELILAQAPALVS